MTVESLELRVQCGRVNHRCGMGVAGHSYGGLGGSRDGGDG